MQIAFFYKKEQNPYNFLKYNVITSNNMDQVDTVCGVLLRTHTRTRRNKIKNIHNSKYY